MTGDVFESLEKESSGGGQKQFDKVEEVAIDQFVAEILPRTTGIECLFEHKHIPNLVSVIAPISDSPTLFKWDNAYSWAYAGNITDSMKQHVKALGGNVDGVLRFSIQWNDNKDNPNDFDAHCKEPGRTHIFYQNAKQVHPSTGMLDVDIQHPKNQIAVENIIYTDINKMPAGQYYFYVNNYAYRGGRSGFTAEIEFNGQIHSFDYPKGLRQDENVPVATVTLKNGEFKITNNIPANIAQRTEWGIQTNQFHPVSVCMFSPNYWDQQTGIGHRHYFFIMNGCKNETQPNGFFNEFLRESLMEHKRVFEALGGKMRVADSDTQLSGLGFSATKRNSLVCKLEGSMSRTIKLIF